MSLLSTSNHFFPERNTKKITSLVVQTAGSFSKKMRSYDQKNRPKVIKRIVPEKRSRQKKKVSSNGNQPFFYRKVQGLKTGLKTKKTRFKTRFIFWRNPEAFADKPPAFDESMEFYVPRGFLRCYFQRKVFTSFLFAAGVLFSCLLRTFLFLYAFLVSFLLTCGPAHTLETKTLAERKGKKT